MWKNYFVFPVWRRGTGLYVNENSLVNNSTQIMYKQKLWHIYPTNNLSTNSLNMDTDGGHRLSNLVLMCMHNDTKYYKLSKNLLIKILMYSVGNVSAHLKSITTHAQTDVDMEGVEAADSQQEISRAIYAPPFSSPSHAHSSLSLPPLLSNHLRRPMIIASTCDISAFRAAITGSSLSLYIPVWRRSAICFRRYPRVSRGSSRFLFSLASAPTLRLSLPPSCLWGLLQLLLLLLLLLLTVLIGCDGGAGG